MRRLLWSGALIALLTWSCGGGETITETTGPGTTGPAAGELVLVTHDSFAISESVLNAFAAETGIEIAILRAGDAGTLVNQAILTADNPLGDVLFGVDNTFLSRPLEAGVFEPYQPAGLDFVPAELQLDSEHRLTPIDFGDVCVNYDKAFFEGRRVPVSLADLADPEFRGLLVVEDPATSSPGLAFLMATVGTFAEESDYTWLDYWQDLVANDVMVTSGWEQAYYSASTWWGGDRPLVVSYASSPPAEVFYAEDPIEEAPTGVVESGCFRQVEFAGILTGTERREEAEQLMDFLLTIPFQEDIPLNIFVFPARRDANLPQVFVENTVIPTDPITLDPAVIDENRELWIEAWTEIVLP